MQIHCYCIIATRCPKCIKPYVDETQNVLLKFKTNSTLLAP